MVTLSRQRCRVPSSVRMRALPEVEEEDVGWWAHGLGGENDHQHQDVPQHPDGYEQAKGAHSKKNKIEIIFKKGIDLTTWLFVDYLATLLLD